MVHNTEEFLGLLNLSQASRRCAGIDCPDVSADAMEQARILDTTRERQPETCHGDKHSEADCPDCKRVKGLQEGLSARMGAQGIDIPANLF